MRAPCVQCVVVLLQVLEINGPLGSRVEMAAFHSIDRSAVCLPLPGVVLGILARSALRSAE